MELLRKFHPSSSAGDRKSELKLPEVHAAVGSKSLQDSESEWRDYVRGFVPLVESNFVSQVFRQVQALSEDNFDSLVVSERISRGTYLEVTLVDKKESALKTGDVCICTTQIKHGSGGLDLKSCKWLLVARGRANSGKFNCRVFSHNDGFYLEEDESKDENGEELLVAIVASLIPTERVLTSLSREQVDEFPDSSKLKRLVVGGYVEKQKEALSLSFSKPENVHMLARPPLQQGAYQVVDKENISEGGVNVAEAKRQQQRREQLHENVDDQLWLLNLPQLNPSQAQAAERVLDSAKSREDRGGVRLIQGPPGTGKTSLIVHVLCHLIMQNDEQVIQAATTNTAVVQVAKRLIEKLPQAKLDNNALVISISEAQARKFIDPDSEAFRYVLPIRAQTALLEIQALREKLLSLRKELADHLANRATDNFFTGAPSNEDSPPQAIARERAMQLDHGLSQLVRDIFPDIAGAARGMHHAAVRTLGDLSSFDWFQHLYRSVDSLISKCPPLMLQVGVGVGQVGLNLECKTTLDLFYWTQNQLVQKATVIFCTVNGSMAKAIKSVRAPIVIVDEAAQSTEAETTCLMRPHLRLLVLVGDPQQLPAVVFCEKSRPQLARSLFERLQSSGHHVDLLKEQYRMHPEISQVASQHFYGGRVLDSEHVKTYSDAASPWATLYESPSLSTVQYVIHKGSKSQRDASGSSSNVSEAQQVIAHIDMFCQQVASHPEVSAKGNLSIGIITPYRAQKELLKDMLHRYQGKKGNFAKAVGAKIDVNTVDGFQGQERDAIYVSLTATGTASRSPFIHSERRVNVTITRAKFFLVVFGDSAFAHNSGLQYEFWRDFANRFSSSHPEQRRALSRSLEKLDFISPRDLLGNSKSSLAVWNVLANECIHKLLARADDNLLRSLSRIICKLKRGDFSGSSRPYFETVALKSDDWVRSAAASLMYVSCTGVPFYLVWTIAVRERRHVIYLLSHQEKNSLGQVFERFTSDLRRQPEKDVELRSNYIQVSDKSFVPRKGIEPSAAAPGGNFTRSLTDSAKIFDITANKYLKSLTSAASRREAGQSIAANMAIPYLLDTYQQRAAETSTGNIVIIGRGGSGKTSAMVNSLFNEYSVALKAEMPPRKVVFVSQSSLLVSAVRKEFYDLANTFRVGEGLAPSDFSGEVTFLSLDELITCVDQNLPGPGRLFGDASTEASAVQVRLQNLGERNATCGVIANLLSLEDDLIHFERFENVYWRMASSQLQRAVSPALLFTELAATIKGGSKVAGMKRDLTRAQYMETAESSRDISPALREQIYTFYERFETERCARGQLTLVDVCRNFSKRMVPGSATAASAAPAPPTDSVQAFLKVDQIMLDEIQDLMPCAWVLLAPFRDDNTRLVCGGDQAQAITAGTRFRFTWLKDYLYRSTTATAAAVPKEVHLEVAYRSSAAILRLANQVVSALRFFFPGDIDALREEESATTNCCDRIEQAPKLMEEADLGGLFDAIKSDALSSEQVLLVRTRAEKKALEAWLQEREFSAAVLTILESKGLEFDYIFLVNVLAGPASEPAGWLRVLFNYANPENVPKPQFAPQMHHGLCFYFKELYVGLTRARRGVYFVEANATDRDIFFDVFQGKGLERSSFALQPQVFQVFAATNTSPAEWAKKAEEFVNAGLLEQALVYFQHAGADFRRQARMTEAKLFQKRYEASGDLSDIMQAADLWKELGEDRSAADLLLRAKQYKSAASLYSKLGLLDCCADALGRKPGLESELFECLEQQDPRGLLSQFVRQKIYGGLAKAWCPVAHKKPRFFKVCLERMGLAAAVVFLQERVRKHDDINIATSDQKQQQQALLAHLVRLYGESVEGAKFDHKADKANEHAAFLKRKAHFESVEAFWTSSCPEIQGPTCDWRDEQLWANRFDIAHKFFKESYRATTPQKAKASTGLLARHIQTTIQALVSHFPRDHKHLSHVLSTLLHNAYGGDGEKHQGNIKGGKNKKGQRGNKKSSDLRLQPTILTRFSSDMAAAFVLSVALHTGTEMFYGAAGSENQRALGSDLRLLFNVSEQNKGAFEVLEKRVYTSSKYEWMHRSASALLMHRHPFQAKDLLMKSRLASFINLDYLVSALEQQGAQFLLCPGSVAKGFPWPWLLQRCYEPGNIAYAERALEACLQIPFQMDIPLRLRALTQHVPEKDLSVKTATKWWFLYNTFVSTAQNGTSYDPCTFDAGQHPGIAHLVSDITRWWKSRKERPSELSALLILWCVSPDQLVERVFKLPATRATSLARKRAFEKGEMWFALAERLWAAGLVTPNDKSAPSGEISERQMISNRMTAIKKERKEEEERKRAKSAKETPT